MEPFEFLVHCQVLLEEGSTSKVLTLLQDDNNNSTLSDVGWELVSVLCKQFTRHENEEQLVNIEKSMMILLQKCSAKEVMLGLSEHLVKETSLKSYTITMRLCKLTFIRLERRQSKYMSNLCKHLSSKMEHILQSSLYNEDDMSTKEKKNDYPALDICCNFLSSSIDFLDGIVPYIGRTKSMDLESFLCEPFCGKYWSSDEIQCCREIALIFIFQLLHNCVESKIFSNSSLLKHQELITRLVLFTFKFFSTPDLLCLIQRKGDSKFDHTGVVIFFHLLLVKFLGGIELPMVYECSFWFKLITPFLSSVLKLSSIPIVRISLELLSTLSSSIDSCSKSMSFLQSIALSLTKIMVWCQEDILRKKSERAFRKLLELLDEENRYLSLVNVYNQSDHPGVLGYLINHILKSTQAVVFAVNSATKIDTGDLTLLFTKIAVGENNVLQESDRYMAALNFARFWLLKDSKTINRTGIWNKVDQLNKNMSIISNCLDLSKCEFKKQLEQLHNPKLFADEDFCTDMITCLIGGEVFPELSADDKLLTVNRALLTLDMMSSVIARIDEIITAK